MRPLRGGSPRRGGNDLSRHRLRLARPLARPWSGPPWLPLAVGLGCVDGPKQLQPVALCLSRDDGPPLEFFRTYEHLTLPRGTPGSDLNFRELRQETVRKSSEAHAA